MASSVNAPHGSAKSFLPIPVGLPSAAMRRLCPLAGPRWRVLPNRRATRSCLAYQQASRRVARHAACSSSEVARRRDRRTTWATRIPRLRSTTMNRDQVKGNAKNIAGKVQQKVGELTGNKTQQAKGLAKQVAGNVQKGVGNVEQAIGKANRKTR